MIVLLKVCRFLLNVFGGFMVSIGGIIITILFMAFLCYAWKTGLLSPKYFGPVGLLICTIVFAKYAVFAGLRGLLHNAQRIVEAGIVKRSSKPAPKYFY